MKTPKITPNLPLLVETVNQICQHPETHDQLTWHSQCGTKHCVAGWGQIKSGKPLNSTTAKKDAQEAFGLNDTDASWLFADIRTKSEIHGFVESLIKGKEYFDRSGRDSNGYDRNGRDRNGYDRDGRDRNGYDRYGYDRNGYDSDGYDRNDYDSDGFEHDGYDRDGFNRDGFNRDGNKLPVLTV